MRWTMLGKVFDLIHDARENAESTSDSYVELARAVLMISRSEAAAYFNKAVEVASKIGDENLDRWGALLDLADRAASPDRPNPVIAYRLARCAELTYKYVVRDKHFDWKATVEAITGLCGKSSFAISAVGGTGILDGQRGYCQPRSTSWSLVATSIRKIALALIGFRAQWNEPLLLKSVLLACTKAEKEVAAGFVYRYMTLDQQGVETWCGLKSVLAEHGIAPAGLDERITLSEREEQSSRSRENSYDIDRAAAQESKKERDWNVIFEGVDSSFANDISARANHL